MKQRRIRLIKEVLISEEGAKRDIVKVTLAYSDGGLSYFDYKQYPRGYYLSAKRVTEEKKDGYTMETWEGFAGVKQFVEGANRYNEKRLSSIILDENIVANLVAAVYAKEIPNGGK